jgi:hypothetical protein
MYHGQPVFFNLHEEGRWERDRDAPEEADKDPEHEPKYVKPTFALHALTDQQYRELEDHHNEFGRLVGRHTDHRPEVYAPYEDKGTSHLWYDTEDSRKLSFLPTEGQLLAIVPSSSFTNYARPRGQQGQ